MASRPMPSRYVRGDLKNSLESHSSGLQEVVSKIGVTRFPCTVGLDLSKEGRQLKVVGKHEGSDLEKLGVRIHTWVRKMS